MHLLTIRPALALLTILPYVFGFNINRLLDIFNEEHLAERFQPGFRLPFRRQASSVFVATPTSAGGGSAIVTTVPQSNPPSFVTTSGVSITDTGGSTEVSVSTVPPPSSSPSSSPSAGCAAGYASFNGGCCASVSMLNCNGATYCTSACPPSITSTTSIPPALAPPSSSNPVVPAIITSSSLTGTPWSSPSITQQSQATSSSPIPNEFTSNLTPSPSPQPTQNTNNQPYPSNPSIFPTETLSKSSRPITTGSALAITTTISGTPITTTINVDTSPSTHSGGELSTGAKAGIGIGIGVVFLTLLAILLFFAFKRRGRQVEPPADESHEKEVVRVPPPGAPPPYGSELHGRGVYAGGVMEGMGPYAEAPGTHDRWRHELSIERYNEMPGVEVFRGHELDVK